MTQAVFFTIVANNYLGYARTLMASLREHHPDSVRIVFLCDEPATSEGFEGLAELVPARELGIDDFPAMAFAYDVMELATAIKPSCFLRLGAAHPGADIIYLDPDILVTAPLVHVRRALAEGASLVLTPHLTAPLQDGFMPDDLTIMKSGIYNLGFAAMRMTAESAALAEWWRDRCRRDAVVDIAENKFTDQRWMDMAPAFVRRTHILHDHAYNLAYWNLAHRRVTREGDATLVDGEPLRFVHFSGVNPADPSVFSKHQTRFAPETLGALRPLFERYVALVRANGWAEYRRIPYAYDRFESGRRIHPMMRLSFRRHEEAMADDPFAGDGAVFDGPEPSLAALGPPAITRAMHELWQRRVDLRQHFDIQSVAGREAYLRWFAGAGGIEAGFDAASVEAAASVLARREAGPAALPPWPPQAGEVFDAPRAGLAGWLAAPVPLNVITDSAGVPIPRHLALVWEGREDLSRHFGCQTAEGLRDFLFWCISSGVGESEVDLGLIEPTVSPYLNAAEAEAIDGGPPVTRLMRLAAPHYDGPFPQAASRFPESLDGRLAVALWLRGKLARELGWPPGFLRRLDEWGKARAAPFAEGGLPIGNLLHAMLRLRADVREVCDTRTLDGQLRFLSWVVNYGMREAELPLDALPDELMSFLAAPVGTGEGGFRRLHSLAWAGRPDLRAGFDVATAEGQAALVACMAEADADAWDYRAWLDRLAPPARPARPAPAPGRVLLTGLVDVASGRGEDVRMTAAALGAQGVPYAMLDRRSGARTGPGGAVLAEEWGGWLANIVHHNADTALRDHLFLRRHGAAECPAIGYWAWELSELPAQWASAFSFYDEIWASTRFACEAFRRVSPRPVQLMPMPVRMPATEAGRGRAEFGLPEDRFVFYYGFDFRSYTARKNPEGAIAAFRRAFPEGTENVVLVIKTLAGERHAAELEALRRLAGGDARILIRDQEYSAVELATLIGLCDCFLSLHRSEGFGRGPAEAMLLGKPVIATGYSGNIDFMDETNSLLVDYRLIPVRAGEYPGWEGQEWADPDVEHAALLMRRVAGDAGLAARIGAAARRTISERHSPEATGRLYARRLEEIGALRREAGRRAASGRRRRARAAE